MPITLTCQHCENPFNVKPTQSGRRFCSDLCFRQHEKEHGRPAARVSAVNFTCRECQKPFQMMPSYVAAYRKKFGRDPLYCSIPCSAIGRRKDADLRNRFVCKNCGKESERTRRPGGGNLYYQQELCSKQCKNEWVSKVYRQKHGLPKTTRRVKRKYAVLHIPAQNGNPAYEILEHRYVMEQHLGRKLHRDETVHHISGDRFDNSLKNLELFSSRHGPGQRVIDKIQFAAEMMLAYPEFVRRLDGDVLAQLHEITGALPLAA